MQLLFCFDKTRDVKEKSFQTSSAKYEEKLEVNFQQRFCRNITIMITTILSHFTSLTIFKNVKHLIEVENAFVVLKKHS